MPDLALADRHQLLNNAAVAQEAIDCVHRLNITTV